MNAYARAFDPHSSYFSPRSSEEYRIQMSLNYEGIGASLQLIDDYVTIMNVLEGGPAAVAGTLNVNDRITGVGQGKDGGFTDVIGWRLDDVVQLIRGKAGTLVRLQILPAGAGPGAPEKVLEFTRNQVTLEAQAAHKEVKNVARNGKAQDRRRSPCRASTRTSPRESSGDKNYRSTTRDVAKLLKELKSENIDGLVLDLRNDGGGYLPEATALTGLFIDHGPVVQLRDTTGRLEVLDDPQSMPTYDGPLAVLVDRLSASASEIFAGAIQDYHRGVILGQTTFGKGTVQNLVPLDRWSSKPDERPAHRDHRQVLPRDRREHPAPRRGAGRAARLGDRHQGNRRERARVRAALGSHRRRAVQDQRGHRGRPADRGPGHRGGRARAARSGLPVAGVGHRGARFGARAEDRVAEPQGAARGAHAHRQGAPRAREQSARGQEPAGVQERGGAGQGQGHRRRGARPGEPGDGGRARRREESPQQQKTARSG